MPGVNESVCLPLVWFIAGILCDWLTEGCTAALLERLIGAGNNVVAAAISRDVQI